MIALTLVLEPAVVIADEPTTALDTISQFEVVEQFIQLRERMGGSMIFVSHDLGVVKKIADEVLVMRNGVIVESGSVEEVFTAPQHPYTQYLVSTRLELSHHFNKIMSGECNVLKVENVHKSYRVGGLFSGKRRRILEGVSFECGSGECLGIIGESGSGKSTLGRLILGIEKPDLGHVLFEGNHVIHRHVRFGNISAVFQDYTSSINPFFTVEQAIMEPLTARRPLKDDHRAKIDLLLNQVGLDASYKTKYAHELSGGEARESALPEPLPRNRSVSYSTRRSALWTYPYKFKSFDY